MTGIKAHLHIPFLCVFIAVQCDFLVLMLLKPAYVSTRKWDALRKSKRQWDMATWLQSLIIFIAPKPKTEMLKGSTFFLFGIHNKNSGLYLIIFSMNYQFHKMVNSAKKYLVNVFKLWYVVASSFVQFIHLPLTANKQTKKNIWEEFLLTILTRWWKIYISCG